MPCSGILACLVYLHHKLRYRICFNSFVGKFLFFQVQLKMPRRPKQLLGYLRLEEISTRCLLQSVHRLIRFQRESHQRMMTQSIKLSSDLTQRGAKLNFCLFTWFSFDNDWAFFRNLKSSFRWIQLFIDCTYIQRTFTFFHVPSADFSAALLTQLIRLKLCCRSDKVHRRSAFSALLDL